MLAEGENQEEDMCRHTRHPTSPVNSKCSQCESLAGPLRNLLSVEGIRHRSCSITSDGSGGSATSPLSTNSNFSGRSVDHEREELAQNNGLYFGCDLKFADEKKVLSEMVRTKEVLIGSSDHKTRLIKRVGGGSFGEVYLGQLCETNEDVAVKIEPQNMANKFLLHEGTVYRQLEGGPGIPQVHWFGMFGSNYTGLVMELLGPTLEHHFEVLGKKFSLKTTLQLVDHMLDTIGHIHTNFVHRDLSPNNFMLGVGDKSSTLYLIDYGHAKKLAPGFQYVPGRVKTSKSRPMVGTPRFASIHTHQGREESRRDDLESLCYIWIYFLKGRLPWQGVRASTHEEKLKRILELKMKTPINQLCEGLPKEFGEFLQYVHSLKVYDKPDYKQIKGFFRQLFVKEGFADDGIYDWDHGKPAVTIPTIITTDVNEPTEPSPLVTLVSH